MQLGAISIVIRQTNIIWMLFVACCGILNLIEAKKKHANNFSSEPQFGHFASSSSVKVNSNLKRRRSGNAIHTSTHPIHGKSLHQSTGLHIFIFILNSIKSTFMK